MVELIRILLVDDHPVVRDGLASLLNGIGGFLVTAQAADPVAALAFVEANRPDVVLCDLFFGGLPSGFDLLATLAADPTAPPLVLFSQFNSASLLRTALDAGAAGYLSKDAPVAEITQALRSVAAGRSAWTNVDLRTARSAPPAPDLRERRILAGIARGDSNSEIAAGLDLAPKTIEGKLAVMFRRHGVVSRAELVAKAISEGWISSGSAG